MSTSDVVERLQHLGMSGYEAKSYVALVAAAEPLNGYEVAKRSGVPRSTVYETLGKLVARGAAFEVRSADGAVNYLPLPARSLLDRLGRDYRESLAVLDELLPAVSAAPSAHLIHNLDGAGALVERARDVVSGSTREIFLSVWPEDFEALRTDVRAALDRGVRVTVLCFGEIEDPVGTWYQHELSSPAVVVENLGCRLLTVVGDRAEAVIGGITDTGTWGVYTDNPAVVMLCVEYVRHDIAIQLIGQRFQPAEFREFWERDPDLGRLRADHGLPAAALQAAQRASDARALSTRTGGRKRATGTG